MGPDNVIIGESGGIDLPQLEIDPKDLSEEKRKAKYSKSREFKDIRSHWEDRIAFYQAYLPDGRPVVGVDSKELGDKWLVANCIIAEIKTKLMEYDMAKDMQDAGL